MRKKKAFTLIELLVVVAIIALLISILLPSLSRARELSKRLVCASNVKGMGTAFKIYANDYDEHWPTVPFDTAAGNTNLIRYTVDQVEIGFGGNANPLGPGQQKPNRRTQSDDAARTLSVTRNMWMLVRSGDVTPKSYICPSSGDSIANEQNVDLFYDFGGMDNVSYGYQVPYGPFSTRASEDIDPRLPVAADKGPFSASSPPQQLPVETPAWTDDNNMEPQEWRSFNSGNHGGQGNGEGQNVLFGDGHATFEKTPDVGIDQDNIFTGMDEMTGNVDASTRWSGIRPGNFPGLNAINGNQYATTDSLIYP